MSCSPKWETRSSGGDLLLSFDPQVMEAHRCSLDTPFVFCNCNEGWELEILKTGPTAAGEDIIRLTRVSP